MVKLLSIIILILLVHIDETTNTGQLVFLNAEKQVANLIATPEPKEKITGVFKEDLIKKSIHSSPNNPIIPHGLDALFDIKYLGAFRAEAKGESDSNYATGTLGFNKHNNSLFMAGKKGMSLAEFEIPEHLGFDNEVINLPLARVLQPYVNLKDKRSQGDKPKKITGLLYYNGGLIVNSNIWYDTKNTPYTTQWFQNANNLKKSPFKGMLKLEGRAKAAGYMSEIPENMQKDMDARYLVGWSNVYSINSRYSIGPSLFTFDPQEVVAANIKENPVINTKVKQVYPLSNPIVDNALNVNDDVSAIWGELSKGIYGFIVPNSRYFLVVGSHGGIHSGVGYKISQDNRGGTCSGYCTFDSTDNYSYFWLFKIDDILNAKNIWEARPYSYGKWSHPYDNNGSFEVKGATFDHEQDRLFLSIRFAGRVRKYDRPPLILVYSLRVKEDKKVTQG